MPTDRTALTTWRPIETAPDGDPILLYEPPQVGRHDGIIVSGYIHHCVPCNDQGRRLAATLWMPFPEAPIAKARELGGVAADRLSPDGENTSTSHPLSDLPRADQEKP